MFLKTKPISAPELFVEIFEDQKCTDFSNHCGLAVSAHKIGGDTSLHHNPFEIHSSP